MLIKPLLFTAFIFASATAAHAQDAHEFSGPGCTSHGQWTQTAIDETRALSQTLNGLLNDANCAGIGEVVKNIQVSAQTISNTANTPGGGSDKQNEQNVNDLKSMSEALIAPGGRPDASVSSTFLTRLLGAAQLSSYLQPNLSNGFITNPQAALHGFTTMFKRSAHTAEQGMNVITSVMGALPRYDRCLLGHPHEKLLIASSLVKMTSALSSSGSGANNAIGNTLAGLATMMRDRKFTTALRKNDRVVFSNSVSCLLETVSQHWCEIDNAERIASYFQKERALDIQEHAALDSLGKASQKKRNAVGRTGNELPMLRSNPLNGYYLLTRELPIIADWIQRVQIGAKPRLHTDSGFQNEVLQKVTDLMKLTKTAQGQFSEDIKVLNTLGDKGKQRNQMFSTLKKLVNGLGSRGDAFDASQSDAAFISNTVNDSYLPFYLIGLDRVPKECTGLANQIMTWQDWMQKNPEYNGSYIPAFNDPVALSQIIEKKMTDLLEGAAGNASAYYRNFLIVDRVNLVNETSIGPLLTVKGAFQNIYLYLSTLERDFRESNKSPITLASIVEFKQRIRRFNEAFKRYEELAIKLDQQTIEIVKTKDPVARKKAMENFQITKLIQDAADDVIDTAYQEFNILNSKDGFATTKMRTFIQMDLKNKIEQSKANEKMDSVSRGILSANQRDLLNYTLKAVTDDPTYGQLDLAQAKAYEDANLHTVGTVFKDTLYFMILNEKSYVQGWTGEQFAQHLKRKLAEDSTSVRGMIMPWMKWADGESRHPDLYAELKYLYRGRRVDDEFGAHRKVLGLYCGLSLSLYNRAYFTDVCKDAVLPTYYTENKSLDLNYNAVTKNLKLDQNIPLDAKRNSMAVCSFNRYLIYNKIAFIKDQERNYSSSQKPVSERADDTEQMMNQADSIAVGRH